MHRMDDIESIMKQREADGLKVTIHRPTVGDLIMWFADAAAKNEYLDRCIKAGIKFEDGTTK